MSVSKLDLRRIGGYQLGDTYELMHYSDKVVAVKVTNEEDDDSFIKFIKISQGLGDEERIAGYVAVPTHDSSKIFVRHTAEYFCIGTHTGEGSDGHRKWLIKCCTWDTDFGNHDELEAQRIAGADAILLEDFHGNDVGSTVAFEIHNGYLYSVSNQGTYEVEEVDWTSFYHCVRFPLNDATEKAVQKDKRVYRRQHAEGAIHDSWTDLTLQHDEQTNDLCIVESRREWLGASSKQARTFYTSRISFATPASTDSSWDVDSISNDLTAPLPLPDNDILTTVLGSSHSANYMPTPKQYSWTQHPEFPSAITAGKPGSCYRNFILARTKFRAYNFSCSAFIDLVEDDQCCPNRPAATLPCLRLRIGSRRIAPLDECRANPWRHEDSQARAQCVQFEDNTQYDYSPIRMWPPPPSTCECSKRLHRIMNPNIQPNVGMSSGQKTITAICDERSIVYMVGLSKMYHHRPASMNGDEDENEDDLGTIVLVDFGRLPGPPKLERDGERLYQRWDWRPAREKLCRDGKC